jgi:hypothetical protein
MHNPYAKASQQKLPNSGAPIVSQCSQDPVVSQQGQKQPINNTKKRKFVANPYRSSAKKAPQPPKIEFDEFDDGLDDKALLLALLSAERKHQVPRVSPTKAATISPVQSKFATGNGSIARETAARPTQQHTPSKVRFDPSVTSTSSKNAWESPSQPHFVTPPTTKRKDRCKFDDESDDEFDDDIDEVALVVALEAAEKKRSTSSLPASTPAPTSAAIQAPRGNSSRVLESCIIPRSLFAINRKISTITNHPDDVSALTTDPIVSSQDDDDNENFVEDPEDIALKLRLVSMKTSLEKVLKRKFNHYCRPTDSLMDCIDRLRRKSLIPADLANSMSNIRWLGHMAEHRPKFPVKRSEIDEMIRRYQKLRAENSKRL